MRLSSLVIRSSCAVAILLVACDPAYRVGARQFLHGPRAQGTQNAAVGNDTTAAPLDVEATGDCFEEALRASPARGDIHRWQIARHLRSRETGMNFTVVDSLIPGRRHTAALTLNPWSGQTPALEVYFAWGGSSRSVPLETQKRLVTIARNVLEEVRERCVPAASAPIECVAEGSRGRAVCMTGS